jgi:hypothetical protein
MEPSDDPEKIAEYIKYHFSLEGGRLVAIDERYLAFTRRAPGIQMRIAVSYGPDASKTRAGGTLAPAAPVGTMVFGCHHIGTKGRRLALFDTWLAKHARGVTGEAEILSQAKSILASLDDKMYRQLLTEDPKWRGETIEVGRSAFVGPWQEVHYEEL